jgi:IPT/TIG domain
MLLGIGSLLAAMRPSLLAPTLTAVSHDLADTLGGDKITVSGTNLVHAGISVGSFVSGFWINAEIWSRSDTSITFLMPPKPAGSYSIVAANTGGVSAGNTAGALSIEAWSPLEDPNVTLFCERPGYALSAGVGTWATRFGTAPSQSVSPPPEVDGSPDFIGGFLTAATDAALWRFTSDTDSEGSVLSVFRPDVLAAPVGGNAVEDPCITCDTSAGRRGLAISSAGVTMFHGSASSTYVQATVPITAGSFHAICGRFRANDSVNAAVDGGAFASNPLAAINFSTGNAMRIGSNYGTKRVDGLMRAIVFLRSKCSAAYWTKFHKWSRVRHGVA